MTLELTHLIAFNTALLLAVLSPGPSVLFVTRQALHHGARTGVVTGFGLATMAALWTLAALLGLDAIFTLFPWAYGALKLGGAVYLIYLGVQMWRHAGAPVGEAKAPLTDKRAFAAGMAVNLANPKSVLFAAAVVAVIFPAGYTALDAAVIFANHLIIELIFSPGLALLMARPRLRARYLAFKPALERLMGTVLGALGLRLLLER